MPNVQTWPCSISSGEQWDKHIIMIGLNYIDVVEEMKTRLLSSADEHPLKIHRVLYDALLGFPALNSYRADFIASLETDFFYTNNDKYSLMRFLTNCDELNANPTILRAYISNFSEHALNLIRIL